MAKKCEDKREDKRIETEDTSAQPPRKKRRWLVVLLSLLIFLANVALILQAGSFYTEWTWDFWYPDYQKVDILPLLEKDVRTDEEYDLIYRQTGLTKTAIDDMLSETSNYEENLARILRIQEVYFTPVTVDGRCFAPFTYLDEIDSMTQLVRLRDGDIIVSSTTRVSWFRYGHAALVIDGDAEIIVESIGVGTESKINSALTFCDLANFIVLRPKADRETKSKVVTYARENLIGIPYRLTTGILYDKNPAEIEVSQCAHLAWYAYKRFGIDLDYNGGSVVKPQEISLSDQVEVVQVYGFNPDTLWSE